MGTPQASLHATINETVTTYSPTLSIINNNLDQIGLTLFPNPSSDLAVIQSYAPFVSDLKIELFDINGKLILENSLKEGSTMSYLNLEAVYSGEYFVKISDNKKSIIKKIVVSH